MTRSIRHGMAAGLASVLLVGTLAGCAGGNGDSGGSADEAANSTSQFQEDPGAASGKSADGTATVAPKLARQADVVLTVDDVEDAATKAADIATKFGGGVTNSNIVTAGDADSTYRENTVTMSVPSDKLDDALKAIGELGEVRVSSSSTQDVTSEYVDTTARVETLKASIKRLRELQAKATRVSEVLEIENETTQRQAELDGLTAQLNALNDSVAMSTITVDFRRPGTAVTRNGGFLFGLKQGWSALGSSVVVLLTMIGALLPFAIFFAIVAAPVVWWLRRRKASRRGSGHTPGGPAHPGQGAPPAGAPGAGGAVGQSAAQHGAESGPPNQDQG